MITLQEGDTGYVKVQGEATHLSGAVRTLIISSPSAETQVRRSGNQSYRSITSVAVGHHSRNPYCCSRVRDIALAGDSAEVLWLATPCGLWKVREQALVHTAGQARLTAKRFASHIEISDHGIRMHAVEPGTHEITVELYDLAGRLVKRITPSRSGSRWLALWRSSRKERLPIGGMLCCVIRVDGQRVWRKRIMMRGRH